MNITLYMAISADGYIAKLDGDSDWVSELDNEAFENQIKEKGCIILGNTTYNQYLNDLYPVEDVTNIVMSSSAPNDKAPDNVFFSGSPDEAISIANNLGYTQALLIGGGKTNTSFFEYDLINEIILIIHPLFLGSGIKLFEGTTKIANLKFHSSTKLEGGLVRNMYSIER